MPKKISKHAKAELLDVLRQRYQRAVKQDKSKILDEFVAIAGCNRRMGRNDCRLTSHSGGLSLRTGTS